MRTDLSLSEAAEKNVRRWLNDSYDEDTKHSIRELLQTDVQKLEDAFYTSLSFGTGGMRGLMGVGSNRCNIYTIRELAQGLVNYVSRLGVKKPRIVIGYDTRHNSRFFAEQAALLVSSNGMEALLFDTCCPTPLLSFAVRKLDCHAGIMITASHNPPEYNGYKVYWSDGAQVVFPHDRGISQAIEEVRHGGLSAIHVKEGVRYTPVGADLIHSYLHEIKKLMLWSIDGDKESVKVLYTSLHGTGGIVMKEALALWGIQEVGFVHSQMVMDGAFPTTKIPNPESPQALALGTQELLEKEYDILLATDPDADRVGVVVRHHGKAQTLTGNQIASIMAEWILKRLYEEGRLPPKPALIKSIVTTPLLSRIAEYWNVDCFDVLTGFKYVAEKIRHWEENKEDGYSFVFGGEESLGFLYGTYTRDKDAIVSSCVLSEIAAHFKQQKRTLVDALHDIWKKYGVFAERVKTVAFSETKEGKDRMHACMEALRMTPPQQLGKRNIVAFEDLLQKKASGDESLWVGRSLPSSDVLLFHLEEGGLLCVRPSGTEPKVKLYAMLSSKQNAEKNVEHTLDAEIGTLLTDTMQYMK